MESLLVFVASLKLSREHRAEAARRLPERPKGGILAINEEDLPVITLEGKVIGIPTDKVRPLGRATQGVRIINLEDKDRVCSIAKVRES